MPYHHILVAVDLTEECDPVIHRARELSVSNGAKLSLVHIVEPMAMAFGATSPWIFRNCSSNSSTRPGSVLIG